MEENKEEKNAIVILPKDKPKDKNELVKNEICRLLEEGTWFKDACVLSGISEESGHRWRREDNSFDSRVEASVLRYKQKLIAVITIGSVKNPNLALEILKTRWSQEWNSVKKIEIVDPQKELERIHDMIYGRDNTTDTGTDSKNT